MKVAVIGSGGREHALALKLFNSDSCDQVYCIPGNPGTSQFARNLDVNADDFSLVLNAVKEKNIDLVIIGPEKYLSDGITDYLQDNGIKVFGPTKRAARIESDKAFAKNLMTKYGIPTAAYQTFSSDEKEQAEKYLKESQYPIVIKASGLAAGKGVIIVNDFAEALLTLEDMFSKRVFGDAGQVIVIEEFMSGAEASVFALSDGKDFILLPPAQDHKRIGDNDTGKNTGGMGAYAPAKIVTEEHLIKIRNLIVEPIIRAMSDEHSGFKGCLFCGLMINGPDVKVVEFNARFGDPETQAIMSLIDGDFCKLLYSCASGNLDARAISLNSKASVCVVLASKGYPEKFDKGYEIKGLEQISSEINIYHSGTKFQDGKIITNGGRVLGVTATDYFGDLKSAIKSAYEAVSLISYDNIFYRKDIGAKGIV